jgi:cytochrome oxidase Cu insertion factor (SCO1/SenC/PrrC family)
MHGVRLLAALSLGILLVCASQPAAAERSAAEVMDTLMWNREPVGGPFALIDHTGHPRSDPDFRGKVLVVYFGFTYCPDICPTDLQAIGLALDRLGPEGDSVQPLFITVDPERDTPDHLAEYVALFHPRLIGLTGDSEAIRKAALAYKVFYAKAAGGNAGSYTIDHTAFIYLIGPAGQYLGFLPPGTGPDRLAQVLREWSGASPRR